MICPKCKSEMWDNREKKKTGEFKSNSPDYACRNENCKHVIWPKLEPNAEPQVAKVMSTPRAKQAVDWDKKDEFHARQTAANVGSTLLGAMIETGLYTPAEPEDAIEKLKSVINDLTTKIHRGL